MKQKLLTPSKKITENAMTAVFKLRLHPEQLDKLVRKASDKRKSVSAYVREELGL